jgi:hypothetical protein
MVKRRPSSRAASTRPPPERGRNKLYELLMRSSQAHVGIVMCTARRVFLDFS